MSANLNEFTFIIKTHERKKQLFRLLNSIKRYYPSVRVVVADDSKKPYKTHTLRFFEELNITYLTSNNNGINYGRNLAAKAVGTEFTVLLDDDYVLSPKTDITNSIRLMRDHSIDVLCGLTNDVLEYSIMRILSTVFKLITKLDYKRAIRHIFRIGVSGGWLRIKNVGEIKFYSLNELLKIENLMEIDYGPNFFIIRSETLKKIGYWNENDNPPLDHSGFFEKLKDYNLKICLNRNLEIDHISNRSFYYFFLRRK